MEGSLGMGAVGVGRDEEFSPVKVKFGVPAGRLSESHPEVNVFLFCQR